MNAPTHHTIPGLPSSSPLSSTTGNGPSTAVPPIASVDGQEFDEAVRALLARDPETDDAQTLADLIGQGTAVIQALSDESMAAQLDAKSADLPLEVTEAAVVTSARLKHRVKRAEKQLDALESRLSQWQRRDYEARQRAEAESARDAHDAALAALTGKYAKLCNEIEKLATAYVAARREWDAAPKVDGVEIAPRDLGKHNEWLGVFTNPNFGAWMDYNPMTGRVIYRNKRGHGYDWSE